MKAAQLTGWREPLALVDLPDPVAGAGGVVLKVLACGVCRTDLHIVDGDLTKPKLPLVPGHQIVGTVEACGPGSDRFVSGDRVGVPWLGWTDGTCRFCQEGRENLCESARFTGYDIDGGYAEFAVADQRFCFPLPQTIDDQHVAPTLDDADRAVQAIGDFLAALKRASWGNSGSGRRT